MLSTANIPGSLKQFLRPLIAPKIPKQLSVGFRCLDANRLRLIEASLRENYFTVNDAWYAGSYMDSDQAKNDLQDHLHRRLDYFRKTVIPWLDQARPLRGSRILEIGCGTGSSTVALAEQGADVAAVDILESSMSVAKDRCKAYDLDVDFRLANATECGRKFKGQNFDFIIFFATLEHMTHDERMVAMRETWDMLSPGAFWCVIDTPNRLWYLDEHTSLLPFYHWLPDELAFSYSQFSSRQSFRDLYRQPDDDSKLDFLRWGRGLSFHEFALTMKNVEELDVVSSLPVFLEARRPLRRLLLASRNDRRYESFLTQVGPRIHRGFYRRSLDLIIRKDG